MSKFKTVFQCQSCGYTSPKWLGKCPDCGSWNSFIEEKEIPKLGRIELVSDKLLPLNQVRQTDEKRKHTKIKELDRVLGGGVVDGAVVLIGGDPGIGKSTLLLQAASNLLDESNFIVNQHSQKKRMALYVSGEESPEQIKLRAERLSITTPDILLFCETSIETIIDAAKKINPAFLIIDSIQTVYSEEITSQAGSVSQIRECASKLMFFAKKTATPVFIIGHVTKEGTIAGPRILEHLVDTVLYFEGDRGNPFRIIRTVKNRFGSTNEIGVFTMTDSGIIEVDNPSELFLSERQSSLSGSTVIATIEGTRPLLVEIQALVCPTNFGVPRRTTIGVDFNRVNLLLAVLEKKASLSLSAMDVFINVVGGLKINEPAADLGIVASLVSSFFEVPIDPRTFYFGEVGLTGEVRAVSMPEQRLQEASKIGFIRAFIPENNRKNLRRNITIDINGLRNIEELVESLKG
ncbi:MAG: DNA repair protein RadA [Thermodesulfovibrionales bacterium]|nr:DNA repair protein RadA [Thermodesulfovibrionales bacterium]